MFECHNIKTYSMHIQHIILKSEDKFLYEAIRHAIKRPCIHVDTFVNAWPLSSQNGIMSVSKTEGLNLN